MKLTHILFFCSHDELQKLLPFSPLENHCSKFVKASGSVNQAQAILIEDQNRPNSCLVWYSNSLQAVTEPLRGTPHSRMDMSLSSMQALQHRHNLNNIPGSHLSTSLRGSAATCLEIGHQIKHSNDIKKSTACIQFGLDYLGDEFYGMRSAFREIKHTWAHPTGQRLWTANATKTVKHAQQVAQDVAKALRDVIRQCDTWDFVAPDHFHYQLQAFEIFL